MFVTRVSHPAMSHTSSLVYTSFFGETLERERPRMVFVLSPPQNTETISDDKMAVVVADLALRPALHLLHGTSMGGLYLSS